MSFCYTINNKFNLLKNKRILRDYTCSAYLKNSIDWFWIAGFIQGDGSWVVRSTREEYVLYISQHLMDIQILYKIKKFIGHGYVRIQTKENMAHYVLQHDIGLRFVLNNLPPFVGEKAKPHLKFLQKQGLNFSFYSTDESIYSFINLETAWLSGFIDAEGSFYGTYSKNKKMLTGYQLILRFAITQKDLQVLKLMGNLFKKRVKYNKKGFYYFILSDIESLDKLVTYLKINPLLTKKAISFQRWLTLYNLYKKK